MESQQGGEEQMAFFIVKVMLTLKDRGIDMSRAPRSKQPEIKERPLQCEENT